MKLQKAVEELVREGPFPSENEATQSDLEKRERLLELIEAPISDEEARLLLTVFGQDGCFGMAWTVLHLIETAPSAAFVSYSSLVESDWIKLLEERRQID